MLADIGATIEVSPCDDVQYRLDDGSSGFLADRIPFRFEVAGRLEDGQIFYGLFGPVISGPDCYVGLICNIVVRIDGSDWREEQLSQASFRIGPSIAYRDHRFDFRHPEGTKVDGFPRYGRFAEIEVVDDSFPRPRQRYILEPHEWSDSLVRDRPKANTSSPQTEEK